MLAPDKDKCLMLKDGNVRTTIISVLCVIVKAAPFKLQSQNWLVSKPSLTCNLAHRHI